MLTSEYVAVDGALVLAVPTKLGQDLRYSEIENNDSLIFWRACHQKKLWLKAVIDYKNWKIVGTNNLQASMFVLKIFKNIKELSQTKFQNNCTYKFSTDLEFPENYGLGSSSTLMNNLAEWAEIDPFLLNEKSLGGSGYDVAVAKEKSAILYKNHPRFVEKIDYQPIFKDELIFIHLNLKQDSREGIAHYKSKPRSENLIKEYSELTKKIVAAENIELFSELMQVHEQKLSDFLTIPTVKEKYFENCPVFIKSLGAWGGDFVLSRKFEDYKTYFSEKGFHKMFDWKNLIL